MNENRYTLSGWLAIGAAVLFPLVFAMGIIQAIIAIRSFNYSGPMLGPSDFIMVLVTAMGVYVLLKLRQLLNERYDFHDIDILILVSIWWSIMFQAISISMKIVFIVIWPVSELVLVVLNITVLGAAMVTIGIVDIMIAMRLLRAKETLNDLLKAFAYVTLAAGVFEVSIIMSPLSLLLVPVSCVILGMIFLKEKEEVEFV